jgi:hypothetical protein
VFCLSVIPKSGNRFSEKIMLKQKVDENVSLARHYDAIDCRRAQGSVNLPLFREEVDQHLHVPEDWAPQDFKGVYSRLPVL